MKRKIAEPKWRKVTPTELQFEEVVIDYGGLFTNTKTRMELQEKWERTHAGVVIDTEWRAVLTQHRHWPWEY